MVKLLFYKLGEMLTVQDPIPWEAGCASLTVFGG